MKKPYISKELYDYIQNLFGDIDINIDDTMQQVFFRGGQKSVAKHIKQLYEKQNSQNEL